MKILHIVGLDNPDGNGVAVAVSKYIINQLNYADVFLYNVRKKFEIPSFSKVYSSNDLSICELLENEVFPDIVVFHEVYKPEYLKIYKVFVDKKIPYVIVPHGCLVKKAQKHKIIKKMVGNYLIFYNFLHSASALQFLNKSEQENSIFSNLNFIISGNSISIPTIKNNPVNNHLIFIGRYDLKVKGLDLLLKTVYDYCDWFKENNVTVNLYGRTVGNSLLKLKKIVNNYHISKYVHINDAVYGSDKENILKESYAFVQVSRHEGQPMGIMEALSYGLPCIVTFGTTFGKYVNDNECGIGINFNEEELFLAIKKLYENRDFRDKCSFNTFVIANDFSNNLVTKKCIKYYKNIIKKSL